MKSFLAKAYQAFIEGRKLKADQFLRDHAHLLEQYKARTEVEIEAPAVLIERQTFRERAA
jgi:hypothetical protein